MDGLINIAKDATCSNINLIDISNSLFKTIRSWLLKIQLDQFIAKTQYGPTYDKFARLRQIVPGPAIDEKIFTCFVAELLNTEHIVDFLSSFIQPPFQKFLIQTPEIMSSICLLTEKLQKFGSCSYKTDFREIFCPDELPNIQKCKIILEKLGSDSYSSISPNINELLVFLNTIFKKLDLLKLYIEINRVVQVSETVDYLVKVQEQQMHNHQIQSRILIWRYILQNNEVLQLLFNGLSGKLLNKQLEPTIAVSFNNFDIYEMNQFQLLFSSVQFKVIENPHLLYPNQLFKLKSYCSSIDMLQTQILCENLLHCFKQNQDFKLILLIIEVFINKIKLNLLQNSVFQQSLSQQVPKDYVSKIQSFSNEEGNVLDYHCICFLIKNKVFNTCLEGQIKGLEQPYQVYFKSLFNTLQIILTQDRVITDAILIQKVKILTIIQLSVYQQCIFSEITDLPISLPLIQKEIGEFDNKLMQFWDKKLIYFQNEQLPVIQQLNDIFGAPAIEQSSCKDMLEKFSLIFGENQQEDTLLKALEPLSPAEMKQSFKQLESSYLVIEEQRQPKISLLLYLLSKSGQFGSFFRVINKNFSIIRINYNANSLLNHESFLSLVQLLSEREFEFQVQFQVVSAAPEKASFSLNGFLSGFVKQSATEKFEMLFIVDHDLSEYVGLLSFFTKVLKNGFLSSQNKTVIEFLSQVFNEIAQKEFLVVMIQSKVEEQIVKAALDYLLLNALFDKFLLKCHQLSSKFYAKQAFVSQLQSVNDFKDKVNSLIHNYKVEKWQIYHEIKNEKLDQLEELFKQLNGFKVLTTFNLQFEAATQIIFDLASKEVVSYMFENIKDFQHIAEKNQLTDVSGLLLRLQTQYDYINSSTLFNCGTNVIHKMFLKSLLVSSQVFTFICKVFLGIYSDNNNFYTVKKLLEIGDQTSFKDTSVLYTFMLKLQLLNFKDVTVTNAHTNAIVLYEIIYKQYLLLPFHIQRAVIYNNLLVNQEKQESYYVLVLLIWLFIHFQTKEGSFVKQMIQKSQNKLDDESKRKINMIVSTIDSQTKNSNIFDFQSFHVLLHKRLLSTIIQYVDLNQINSHVFDNRLNKSLFLQYVMQIEKIMQHLPDDYIIEFDDIFSKRLTVIWNIYFSIRYVYQKSVMVSTEIKKILEPIMLERCNYSQEQQNEILFDLSNYQFLINQNELMDQSFSFQAVIDNMPIAENPTFSRLKLTMQIINSTHTITECQMDDVLMQLQMIQSHNTFFTLIEILTFVLENHELNLSDKLFSCYQNSIQFPLPQDQMNAFNKLLFIQNVLPDFVQFIENHEHLLIQYYEPHALIFEHIVHQTLNVATSDFKIDEISKKLHSQIPYTIQQYQYLNKQSTNTANKQDCQQELIDTISLKQIIVDDQLNQQQPIEIVFENKEEQTYAPNINLQEILGDAYSEATQSQQIEIIQQVQNNSSQENRIANSQNVDNLSTNHENSEISLQNQQCALDQSQLNPISQVMYQAVSQKTFQPVVVNSTTNDFSYSQEESSSEMNIQIIKSGVQKPQNIKNYMIKRNLKQCIPSKCANEKPFKGCNRIHSDVEIQRTTEFATTFTSTTVETFIVNPDSIVMTHATESQLVDTKVSLPRLQAQRQANHPFKTYQLMGVQNNLVKLGMEVDFPEMVPFDRILIIQSYPSEICQLCQKQLDMSNKSKKSIDSDGNEVENYPGMNVFCCYQGQFLCSKCANGYFLSLIPGCLSGSTFPISGSELNKIFASYYSTCLLLDYNQQQNLQQLFKYRKLIVQTIPIHIVGRCLTLYQQRYNIYEIYENRLSLAQLNDWYCHHEKIYTSQFPDIKDVQTKQDIRNVAKLEQILLNTKTDFGKLLYFTLFTKTDNTYLLRLQLLAKAFYWHLGGCSVCRHEIFSCVQCNKYHKVFISIDGLINLFSEKECIVSLYGIGVRCKKCKTVQ